MASLTTPAQIDAFRRICIIRSMEMYVLHGIKSTRTATPANMRAMASEYTGVDYPRSRRGLLLAYNDLVEFHNANLSPAAETKPPQYVEALG
jgi:hypothetical protein